MTIRLGAVSLLAGCVLVSACTLNHAERRAATGGAVGAGAGAAGGYLLGYDPLGSEKGMPCFLLPPLDRIRRVLCRADVPK